MLISDSEIKEAAPEDLVSQFKNLVFKLANNYKWFTTQNGRLSLDDLTQCGYIGLLEAQKTYNPEEGSFISWSALYIKKAIRRAIGIKNDGSLPKDFELVSIDEPVPDSEGITIQDTIADPNPTREEELTEEAEKQEIKTAVRDAVDRLKNDNQKEVIRRIWFDGQTKEAAAEEMQRSPVSIRNIDYSARMELSRDIKLKRLAMPYFRVSLARFNTTQTSEVEKSVLWLEEHLGKAFWEKPGQNNEF